MRRLFLGTFLSHPLQPPTNRGNDLRRLLEEKITFCRADRILLKANLEHKTCSRDWQTWAHDQMNQDQNDQWTVNNLKSGIEIWNFISANGSRRNLPKPSQVSKGDDLLSMFSSQPQENDYDSENIVYEPVDDDEVEQDEGTKFVLLIICCVLWFDFNSIFQRLLWWR